MIGRIRKKERPGQHGFRKLCGEDFGAAIVAVKSEGVQRREHSGRSMSCRNMGFVGSILAERK